MKNFSSFEKIFICGYPVDFRKGILSLSALVSAELQEDFFSEALFLFYNKSRNCIKAVYWDYSGFAMWVKLLDKEKFPFPKNNHEKKYTITEEQLKWILSGIDPWKIKTHKKLQYKKII